MGQETELKFIGPEDALSRLRDSPVLRRLAAGGRASTHQLKAVYFDSDDLALRDAGFVLRVRDEGQGFVQTVKSIAGPDAATRTEIKSPVASPEPDLDAIGDKRVRRAIRRALRRRELRPIFFVEMQRTKILVSPKRGTEIEAAFDVGRVTTAGDEPNAKPFAEFELELLRGDANEFVSYARELTAGLPLTLCMRSKGARGYALAQNHADAPVSAPTFVLPAKATADDAFGRIIAHCLHHLLGNWDSVTQAQSPEGIHQMRVAVRRLRCALGLFGGPFRAALRPLEDEVRWFADVLGRARDLDVFEDEVFRPVVAAHGPDDRFDSMSVILQERRRIAWDGVLEALASERFRKLTFELAVATISKPWLKGSTKASRRPTIVLARRRLARRHAKAMKFGKRVDELDAAGRHKLRIWLKKLRYSIDFFASLFPTQDVKSYVAVLSQLQDVLGRMNDAVVARAFVGELAQAARENGEALGYASGVVAGWHLGHSGEHFKKLRHLWARFAKSKPVWK